MNIAEFGPSLLTFGRRGVVVTPSDEADLPGGPVKAVVTLTGGDLRILPAESEEELAFTDVPAGFLPPYIVRRVMATGTTATVATVEG